MPIVRRSCDQCGNRYEAQRTDSRYCTPECRRKAYKVRKAGQVVALPQADGETAAAVRNQLVGVPATSLTAAALVLARRIDSAVESAESGSSLAALVKELRATIGEATKDQVRAADPVDDLRAKRERRLRGIG